MAKYNDPLVIGRADPFVCKHTDGNYYFPATYPAYDRICIRRAASINGITDAEEKVIWRKHDEGITASHIWAPEIHYIMGKWVIYFAAGELPGLWGIKPHALICEGDDPLGDSWVGAGMMQGAEGDPYSLPAFSLAMNGF